MIEIGTRPIVIMQGASFCFGPVSTSLAIAAALRKFDIAIVWLADGTALELLKIGQYDDYIIPFNLHDPDHRRRYAHYIEVADLVVVNTDPDFAEFAVELNEQTIYVDILYWMWNELPKVVERCSLYVYEDFVRSETQINRLGTPAHALRVGPLTNFSDTTVEKHRQQVEKHLLVSLGGLYRPDKNSHQLLDSFKNMVWQALINALKHTDKFQTVYFAGGGVKKSETVLCNGVKIWSGCLPREEHQKLLFSAKAAVLSPGLTGFYEVVASKVPVFFLPPHNYSQYLQLQSYKELSCSPYYSDWERLEINKEMKCFLPEEQMLQQVDEVLANLIDKGDLLTQHLLDFFDSDLQSYDPQPGIDLLKVLEARSGGGAERVAQEIVRRIKIVTPQKTVVPSQRSSFDKIPLPKKVVLELFGGCQLGCPLCPTGKKKKPGRAKGPLKVSTVEALLKEIGNSVEEIELFNWGEPFLNPEACKIIRMISEHGIRTVLSSNLQYIPDPREIIDSGLSKLIVSCHGISQEIYEKYMVGGDVKKTLQNLDRILEAGGVDMKMEIVLRFVVFSHNEHELPLAMQRFQNTPVTVEAAFMRMDMRDEILNSTEQNLKTYGEWVPDSSRFYDKQRLLATRSPVGCNLPFEKTVIDVDGSVSMCCSSFDPKYNVGNFLTEGFAAIWNGKKYQEARRVVTGRGETGTESIICRLCKNNGYRDF